MKPKFRYLLTALTLAALSVSCNFLDEDPDNILPSGAVFGDEAAMKSVLANFYGRLDNPPLGTAPERQEQQGGAELQLPEGLLWLHGTG